jgi:predicted MPP superfamily phosphohydrolase
VNSEGELVQDIDAQRNLAEYIKAYHEIGFLPNKSGVIGKLKQRILDLLEGPWAPDPSDLPIKSCPTLSGNTELPYYCKPLTSFEARDRRAKLNLIENRSGKHKLSTWTTCYDYNIPLPRQHSGLDGLSILHLSDVHLLAGKSRPTDELRVISDYIAQTGRRIDLVFLSGDLITRSPQDLNEDAFQILRGISSKAQHSFFVLGNHDYHGHTPAIVSEWISDAGFLDITNKSVDLRRGSNKFSIHGVDDAYFGSPLAPSLDDATPDRFNILLTHNLDAVRSNFPKNLNCIFSGHTHGGEAWLRSFGYAMKLWNYLDDLNQNIRGWSALHNDCLSFVHPGMARYYVRHPGLWLPPGVVFHSFFSHR